MTGPGRGSGADQARLLALAEEAAADTAEMLARRRAAGRPGVIATKSSATDVVTEADRAAEAMITGRILASRPGDVLLGEEGGLHSAPPGQPPREPAPGPRVRWIVDPLDGTVNYMYGLPDFAVSIAAEVDGSVVAGVVHVPLRAEVFTAQLGGGAWLRRARGEPVRLACTSGVSLSQALVATGFGYEPGRRRAQGQLVAGLLPLVRDIRRGGSAAVDLCSVAAARVDAFYERGLNPWDTAAGALIAREAGAVIGVLAGGPAGPDMTIAAGPGLFDELYDQLASFDPERHG